MEETYNDIVREWFEDIKPLFINYLRKNFNINYDDIMDIYVDVWIAVRENIRRGMVKPNTKWKAYILKVGWNLANKRATRRQIIPSIDDETFDRGKFEAEYHRQKEAENTIYTNPEVKEVLAAELSYIPDPCNKILKLYYFDQLSMTEIADSMNYNSSRSAITTKRRCLERLRNRVENAVRKLGIID